MISTKAKPRLIHGQRHVFCNAKSTHQSPTVPPPITGIEFIVDPISTPPSNASVVKVQFKTATPKAAPAAAPASRAVPACIVLITYRVAVLSENVSATVPAVTSPIPVGAVMPGTAAFVCTKLLTTLLRNPVSTACRPMTSTNLTGSPTTYPYRFVSPPLKRIGSLAVHLPVSAS